MGTLIDEAIILDSIWCWLSADEHHRSNHRIQESIRQLKCPPSQVYMFDRLHLQCSSPSYWRSKHDLSIDSEGNLSLEGAAASSHGQDLEKSQSEKRVWWKKVGDVTSVCRWYPGTRFGAPIFSGWPQHPLHHWKERMMVTCGGLWYWCKSKPELVPQSLHDPYLHLIL